MRAILLRMIPKLLLTKIKNWKRKDLIQQHKSQNRIKKIKELLILINRFMLVITIYQQTKCFNWCLTINIFQMMKKFLIFEGYEKGGRICADINVVSKARSVGKEMVKQIGKKILSGSLNLTKVSFPIRVIIHKSALETVVYETSIFPQTLQKQQ